MHRLFRFLCAIGASVVALGWMNVSGIAQVAKSQSVKVAFPDTHSIVGRQSFSCEAVLESDISGSADKSLTNGIEAKIMAGANKVNVSWLNSSTLTFLSGAAFDAGMAAGAPFSIVKDSKDELAAQFFDGSSMNTFVLNRLNGLAIWSKIRSAFPVYDAPTAGVSYMRCR